MGLIRPYKALQGLIRLFRALYGPPREEPQKGKEGQGNIKELGKTPLKGTKMPLKGIIRLLKGLIRFLRALHGP